MAKDAQRSIAVIWKMAAIIALLGNMAATSHSDYFAIPPRPPSALLPSMRYEKEIGWAATTYRLDPRLIKAIITVESEFNPRCISPKGACGLMQLLPATARRLSVQNIFDPAENIKGGSRHLRYLLTTFSNNLPLTLAAYNAGEGPVHLHKGIPPYAETQDYVAKVLRIYASLRRGTIS